MCFFVFMRSICRDFNYQSSATPRLSIARRENFSDVIALFHPWDWMEAWYVRVTSCNRATSASTFLSPAVAFCIAQHPSFVIELRSANTPMALPPSRAAAYRAAGDQKITDSSFSVLSQRRMVLRRVDWQKFDSYRKLKTRSALAAPRRVVPGAQSLWRWKLRAEQQTHIATKQKSDFGRARAYHSRTSNAFQIVARHSCSDVDIRARTSLARFNLILSVDAIYVQVRSSTRPQLDLFTAWTFFFFFIFYFFFIHDDRSIWRLFH